MLIFSKLSFSQIDTVKIRAVIISAKISKQTIFNTKIDSLFVQNNKDMQLTDLLKQSQSVFIKSFGNFGASTASFRGTSATHTQVLWNGISLNSPMLGQTDFSLIPVFFTDKISISAGISSLASSTGALGGSILLNTFAVNNSKKFSLTLNQSFASFKNYVSSLNFGIKKNKFSANTRYEISSGKNNFRFKNTAIPAHEMQRLENADFKQISILQNFYYTFNKHNQVYLFAWFTNADRNIPPIMSFEGLHRTDKQKDKKIISGIKYSLLFNNIKIENTFAVILSRLDYFLGDSVLSFPKNNFIIKSNSLSTEKTFSSNFSFQSQINNKISINLNNKSIFNFVETYDKATYSQTGYSKQRFTDFLKGIFIFSINNTNVLSFIISEMLVDKKIYSPAFVFSYRNGINIRHGIFTEINAGKNLHIPTLNDLFWRPGGNPDLLPEQGFSADLTFGYKLKSDKINFTAQNTVFASLINNWIIWKPTQFQYWTAQNIKKVFSRGNEISMSFYRKGLISFKSILNYSFTLSTNMASYYTDDRSVGKQLIYIPKHLSNIFILLNYKKIDFSANLNFTSKRYTSTSNYGVYALNSYSLLNFSLSKYFYLKQYKSKISFKINNVLNTQYQAILFRPMPGINFRLNFSLEF